MPQERQPWTPMRFALILAPGIFCWAVLDRVLDDYRQDGPRKRSCYTQAQQQVLHQLKCPATAIFPPLTDPDVAVNIWHEHDDLIGDFAVKSYVDAQNGFGAMVRTPWEGFFNFDGQAIKLKLFQE